MLRLRQGPSVRVRATAPVAHSHFLALFTLAQRLRCAAAILLRPAADIVRRGFAFCFAHRAFCAKLILLRAAADMPCRLPRLLSGFVWLDSDPRNASATRCSFAISASTSPSILFVSKCSPIRSAFSALLVSFQRLPLYSLHRNLSRIPLTGSLE